MNAQMLTELARRMQDYVVTLRRYLHARPELRWEEDETLKMIRAGIEKFRNDDVSISEMRGGLVVDITPDPSDSFRYLFRADVDALQVQEETGLEYASTRPGLMHACGHDTHAAMLLGAYRAIVENDLDLGRNLRFVFQRAEENPTTQSGGDSLVEEGVCDGVTAAYALHIWSNPETGQPGVFKSRAGGMLGNSGRIKFTIRAQGGHVAMPHSGSNALRMVQAVMNHLSGFTARTLKPTDPVSLEPVICNAGKGSNVMPATAELWYGFRTLLPRDQHIGLANRIAIEVQQVLAPLGGTVECEVFNGHPALINTPEDVEDVGRLLTEAGQEVGEAPVMLGGEDFAHYLYKVPGCMWTLGAYTPGTGDHHSPTFCPDESVFWRGVLFWLLLATK